MNYKSLRITTDHETLLQMNRGSSIYHPGDQILHRLPQGSRTTNSWPASVDRMGCTGSRGQQDMLELKYLEI